jgi:hypothetical protein
VQATHDSSKTPRGTGGCGRAKQIEQRGAANGIHSAHGGFYLAMPRVFVVRFKLGAGLS